MTAFNVVRFRVKHGQDEQFIAAHQAMERTFPGARRFSMIKTGDGAYCIVGEWDNFASIVAARPNMIANLDHFREMLEDLGNGLGLTDPVSGEAVIDQWSNGKGRKKHAAPKRKTKAKRSAKKKLAKKKMRRR